MSYTPTRTLFTYEETDASMKSLEVDALLREGGNSVSEITEYPIEFGAPAADHIRDKSDSVTFEFVITNTPLQAPGTNANGATSRVVKRQNGLVGIEFSNEFDRVKSVMDTLHNVRTRGLLWTIYSPLRVYIKFAIENITTERTPKSGNSAKFILQMKRVRIVRTRVVSIPPRRRRVAPTQPLGAQPTQRPRASTLALGADRLVEGIRGVFNR